jgi:hypothetical protein
VSTPIAARLTMIRLIDYLELSGVEIDDALLFQLTALLQAGTANGGGDLFNWCLQQLDGRAHPSARLLPAPTPPILRGSIGFGRRQ